MSTAYDIILAPNPSIMTGPGTNTIILGGGTEGATVIDPADDAPAHLDAIVRAGLARGGIRRILITHGHPDHVGGAAALRARLLQYPQTDQRAGKMPMSPAAPPVGDKYNMENPNKSIDYASGVLIYAHSLQGTPIADEEIADGMTFPAGDDTLRAIHTPGHRFDHHCYLLERQRILFAGDLIAGVGTVVISPPEGDMLDYLNSLKRLQTIDIAEIVPAHGPATQDTQARLAEYIAHRLQREQQIIAVLQTLPPGASIPTMVQAIYADVDPRLHSVAARSVEAHLLKLEREARVRREGEGQSGWTLV